MANRTSAPGDVHFDPDSSLVDFVWQFEMDPRGFALGCFPWGEGDLEGRTLEAWQEEVLDEIGKELQAGRLSPSGAVSAVIQVAVASGHGIGKSALIAMIILWAMATKVNCKGIITANTKTQLTTKTWSEMAKWHRRCLCGHWFDYMATSLSSADPRYKYTWRVDMIPWDEHNPEAFQGLHSQGGRVLMLFDEASAIPDVIWEAAEGAETDVDTEILWIVFGNPTRNTGRFRECFRKFARRWKRWQVDSRTVTIANHKKIAEWEEDHGANSDFFKVRVRGMFPAMAAKQFISTDDVDQAFGRHLREQAYAFAPKVLTCDPAWEGDDEIVMGLRQGLYYRQLAAFDKNDNDNEVGAYLAMLDDEHQADAVFIDAGYGTGIYSYGKTIGRTHWKLVNFGSKAPEEGFRNMRAWLWQQGKDWLKAGGALPPDELLYYDILSPEIKDDQLQGLVQLESKQMTKQRLGRSPNRADAWVLSFAGPVTKRELDPGTKRRRQKSTYEPGRRARQGG